jgi:hypothetical protein
LSGSETHYLSPKDVIDEKTQATLSQVGREEKAAVADEVSPIVCHRGSVAQLRVMGFAEPVIGPDPLAQPILRTRKGRPSSKFSAKSAGP